MRIERAFVAEQLVGPIHFILEAAHCNHSALLSAICPELSDVDVRVHEVQHHLCLGLGQSDQVKVFDLHFGRPFVDTSLITLRAINRHLLLVV